MMIFFLGLVGLFLGAIAGGLLSVGAGFLWTEIFHTSSFEGYSGMLVFFGFMPAGMIVGAIAGAIWLGSIAARKPAEPPGDAA